MDVHSCVQGVKVVLRGKFGCHKGVQWLKVDLRGMFGAPKYSRGGRSSGFTVYTWK